MADETQTQSIQARIASLNVGHVGRAPITANDPDALKRPSLDHRSQSVSVALALHSRAQSIGIGNEPNGARRDGVLPPPTNIIRTGQKIQPSTKPIQAPALAPASAPPPRLPQRRLSTQPSPALPLRRTSDQLSRKASNESIASTISTISSVSGLSGSTARTATSTVPSNDLGRVKAPIFDPASLPPLPPKRTQHDVEKRYQDIERSKAFPGHRDADRARLQSKAVKLTTNVATVEIVSPSATPALPPRRPAKQDRIPPPFPRRQSPPENPPPKPARSALSYGMNKVEAHEDCSRAKSRDLCLPSSKSGAPPPIPLSSRPDTSSIQPVVARLPSQIPSSASSCLLCRDFSAVDDHAAKFPRENVPSLDWLATQLTAPFPLLTDQARSIFTWLHHNVSYDVVAFFGNNLQPSTPASTLATGLAVCEGYAALFSALAAKSGLESVVVGGHGKGFGFASLQPGDPIPTESQGHAWNAVKIDHGHWKLIDCCWGAGNIGGAGQPYNKHFSPRFFTMSNEDFGLRHFSQNRSQLFRGDGRNPSWEEYVIGDPGGEAVRVFSGVAEKEGISETSILPKNLRLPVSPAAHTGPTVRFQFSNVCEHWDSVRHGSGKPFVFVMALHGPNGDDFVPFETNGRFWWLDVEPRKLGTPGQTVSVFTVDTVNGMSARGLSVEEYRTVKGRKAMGFSGLCAWELV